MAISNEKRRAGPYRGDGTTTQFPFTFVVLDKADIAVYLFDVESDAESKLNSGQYTVALNENQDNAPGGLVTLVTPLATGTNLSIISEMAYTQPMVLTNRGGFYPATLNKSADRSTIMSQQLKEKLDRTLVVPVASEETPAEMTQRLLNAQSDAKKYADAAKASADKAEQIENRLTGQEATLLEDLKAEGKKQVGVVKAEGDTQIERLQTATDQTLVGYGIAGVEQTWTVANDTPSGSTITLPLGMSYVVGHHHLRLVWNGLVLVKDDNFSEIGVADSIATTFKINFELKQGDQLNAWAIPLGRGDSTNVLERVATVEQSMADLSRTVAYREGAK